MKKIHITIALVLWSFAQVAEAQNMYRNYSSTTIPSPESAVSLVHSNGHVYYFQTGKAISSPWGLSVAEVDPYSLLPTGINNSAQVPFEFMLNGAFEDFDGDCVLFGYDRSNNGFPIIMKIDPNLLNVYVYWTNTIEGSFIAGCAGYDGNGEKIYALVGSNGKLYVGNKSNLTLFREFTANQNAVFYDQYTDISWDSHHNLFVATGSAMPTNHDHLHPFVGMLKLDIPPLAQNTASATTVYSYILDNITYEKVTEHKALHVQLSSNELLLYRDLQEDINWDVHDVIWLTRIYDFWNTAVSVQQSCYYLLPDAKLMATDMVYDYKNNRINFLGVFNHCMQGLTQLLAQADPYSLTLGLNVGQLGGAFSGSTPCQSLQYPYVDIYYNNLEMKNLAYNYYNPCLPVLIAGVNGSGSVLTETYDILASSCDRPLDVNVVQASPIPQLYTISNGSMDKNFTPFPITFSTDFLSMQYLCDEPSACSHQFGGKSIRKTLLNKESVREIISEGDNQFLCEGFDGNIQYSLYDMAGKLLQKGTIRNGERNHLNVSEGVYLIRAFDTSHSLVVKKVVIF